MRKTVFLLGLMLLLAFYSQVAGASGELFLSSYNSLPDALNAIGSDEVSLVIDQNAGLTSALEIPENVNLRFVKGNTISGSYTLTINGGIDAGSWQIFGSGTTPAGQPKIKEIPPEWFPGTDTQSIQAAINFAAVAGAGVSGSPQKTYNVSSVRIKNGVKSFTFKGSLKGDGTSAYGIVALDGPIFGTTAVDGCYISVNVDMSEGNTYGIDSGGCTNCIFDNCRITGFTSTTGNYGMLFRAGSSYNKIISSEIVGYPNPAGWSAAIFFQGSGGASSTGYLEPTAPCVGNIISGNILRDTASGIYLYASKDSTISRNYFFNNSKSCGMFIANSTSNCMIANNIFKGFGNIGVYCSSGVSRNKISANIFRKDTSGGSAAVYIANGSTENAVSGNLIECCTANGIYVGTNVVGNVIDGNKISGYTGTAITLENDSGSSASVSAEENVIQNNVIGYENYGAAATAISVRQRGTSTQTRNNTIQSNVIVRPQSANNSLYFYEEYSGYLTGNILRNNSIIDPDLSKIILPRGRGHFAQCHNNSALDYDQVTFASGDTTPSVGKGGYFKANNTAATTITYFDDGFDGQTIIVQLDANTTIQYSGAAMVTKGNVNIVGSGSNQFVTFKKIGASLWYEINRSF